jgi:outer membrane usher protein
VFVGGQVVPSGQVSDAFILVDANGHSGVPVLFENQRVGTTDSRGRLLVPGVSAYHSAKVSIDPLNLPVDIRFGATEHRVTVRRRGGTVVHFDVRRVVAASVRLIGRGGNPLPVGTPVTHLPTRAVLVVGWGGLVYVEDVKADNLLSATLADGTACSAVFADATRRLGFGAIETLECHP